MIVWARWSSAQHSGLPERMAQELTVIDLDVIVEAEPPVQVAQRAEELLEEVACQRFAQSAAASCAVCQVLVQVRTWGDEEHVGTAWTEYHRRNSSGGDCFGNVVVRACGWDCSA